MVRFAGWVRWVLVIFLLTIAGVGARYLTWDHGSAIRGRSDMRQRWVFGEIAARDGIRQMVEDAAAEHRQKIAGVYQRLDYMPLRLWAMELWYLYTRQVAPDARDWQETLVFNGLLLVGNMAAEAISAVLVWMLIREAGGGRWLALAGSAALWLNPMILVVGYGYLQWDSWSLPFCLGALWLVMRERWLASGAVLAAGMLIKGQLILVAPFFLLVALLAGEWRKASQWALGSLLVICVGIGPWLVHGSLAPLRVGFVYGAELAPALARKYCQNLPALASYYLGWQGGERLLGIPVEVVFGALYVAGLATICHRCADVPREQRARVWPLAFGLVWLWLYFAMPRLLSRYLIWATSILIVPCVRSRRGCVALGILTMLGATVVVLTKLDRFQSGDLPGRWVYLRLLQPHGAWIVMGCLLWLMWWLWDQTRERSDRRSAQAASPAPALQRSDTRLP